MPTTSQRQSAGESTTATSGNQALAASDVAALVGNIVVTELVEAANASDEASLLQSLEELTHEQGIREDASGLSEIVTELVLGLEQGLLTPSDVGVDAVRSEGLAMLREVADLLGQAESDESSMWSDWLGNSDESWWENESQDATLATLAQALLPTRASGTTEIDLKSGTTYTVTDGDLQGGDEAAAWKAIARQNGMHEDTLIAFNQHVATVQVDEHAVAQPVTPTLTAGTDLYLPSTQEQLLFQCRDKAGSYEGGVALYAEVAGLESNIALLETARERSSGDIGEGYGIPGLDGKFLTENPDLAGASERRTTKIDGKKQYKVNWGAEFWKCSLFLHDVIFSTGLEPHMTENQHYLLAGKTDSSDKFKELSVEQARPGHIWQRDGGSGADESHVGILSSFVDVSSFDAESDAWSFSIIGAEKERAAESNRTLFMEKGTNKTSNKGRIVRFFEPAKS